MTSGRVNGHVRMYPEVAQRLTIMSHEPFGMHFTQLFARDFHKMHVCLLTLMGSWRLWIFLIPLSSHELSTTLKHGRFQLAQIHGSIYIIVQMETSTTASNSVSKCLLSKYGFETILDQDMYTWMRGYEYLTSTLTSKGLQMGIKLAVPVYSWRLVGISRWENLCILELSVGSIPSKPYW